MNDALMLLVHRAEHVRVESQSLLGWTESLLERRYDLIDERLRLLADISEDGRDFSDAVALFNERFHAELRRARPRFG